MTAAVIAVVTAIVVAVVTAEGAAKYKYSEVKIYTRDTLCGILYYFILPLQVKYALCQ